MYASLGFLVATGEGIPPDPEVLYEKTPKMSSSSEDHQIAKEKLDLNHDFSPFSRVGFKSLFFTLGLNADYLRQSHSITDDG